MAFFSKFATMAVLTLETILVNDIGVVLNWNKILPKYSRWIQYFCKTGSPYRYLFSCRATCGLGGRCRRYNSPSVQAIFYYRCFFCNTGYHWTGTSCSRAFECCFLFLWFLYNLIWKLAKRILISTVVKWIW